MSAGKCFKINEFAGLRGGASTYEPGSECTGTEIGQGTSEDDKGNYGNRYLEVVGYACSLFRDDRAAKFMEKEKHLIECEGELVDRFDARLSLQGWGPLTIYEAPINANGKTIEDEEENQLEQELKDERYKDFFAALNKKSSVDRSKIDTVQKHRKGKTAKAVEANREEGENENEQVYCPPKVPPEIKHVPKTEKILKLIHHTASSVVKKPQLEIYLRFKQGENKDFDFLKISNELYPYFVYIRNKLKRDQKEKGKGSEVDVQIKTSNEQALKKPTCEHMDELIQATVDAVVNNSELERYILAKETGNENFSFLNPCSELHCYYQHLLKTKQNRQNILRKGANADEAKLINKTAAAVVAKPHLEATIMNKQKDNPIFGFLEKDNPLHIYYVEAKNRLKDRDVAYVNSADSICEEAEIPETEKLRNHIVSTAKSVFEMPELEVYLQKKEKTNDAFGFLSQGNKYHKYYKCVLENLKNQKANAHTETETETRSIKNLDNVSLEVKNAVILIRLKSYSSKIPTTKSLLNKEHKAIEKTIEIDHEKGTRSVSIDSARLEDTRSSSRERHRRSSTGSRSGTQRAECVRCSNSRERHRDLSRDSRSRDGSRNESTLHRERRRYSRSRERHRKKSVQRSNSREKRQYSSSRSRSRERRRKRNIRRSDTRERRRYSRSSSRSHDRRSRARVRYSSSSSGSHARHIRNYVDRTSSRERRRYSRSDSSSSLRNRRLPRLRRRHPSSKSRSRSRDSYRKRRRRQRRSSS